MKNKFFKILFLSFITLSMCLSLTDCSKDKMSIPTESVEESESQSVEKSESQSIEDNEPQSEENESSEEGFEE